MILSKCFLQFMTISGKQIILNHRNNVEQTIYCIKSYVSLVIFILAKSFSKVNWKRLSLRLWECIYVDQTVRPTVFQTSWLLSAVCLSVLAICQQFLIHFSGPHNKELLSPYSIYGIPIITSNVPLIQNHPDKENYLPVSKSQGPVYVAIL